MNLSRSPCSAMATATTSVFPDDAHALIYWPAHSVTMSAPKRKHQWKLQFERRSPQRLEPLMGWTEGDDPLTQWNCPSPRWKLRSLTLAGRGCGTLYLDRRDPTLRFHPRPTLTLHPSCSQHVRAASFNAFRRLIDRSSLCRSARAVWSPTPRATRYLISWVVTVGSLPREDDIEAAMETLVFDDVRATERKLLAVFERHGPDGRAITIDSLAANVGVPKHARALAMALSNLAARGLITVAGQDPIPGSPLAFRLARPSARLENVDEIGGLPRRNSPPLSPRGG
jgi:hypothetical protein